MNREVMINEYFEEDNEYGFHAYAFGLRIDFYEAVDHFQIDQVPVSDELVKLLVMECPKEND